MNIDPGVVAIIQSSFVERINSAFATVSNYAFNLLYLFAAIELAIVGIAWMIQRDTGWDKLFFKIIKIGLIFFIIRNYSWLIHTILDSFAQLAGIVIRDSTIAEYIFNPAKIWEYGYDIGVNLLHIAAETNLVGLAMILVTLGMGILLAFGLLGIQLTVQIVGFYMVSFGALILLPFGALTASQKMLDKAVQSVLQAGIRLMVLIIIIGLAVIVWNGFELTELASGSDFNISQPLGLFFTALLFLCLAFYLPKVVSQAVGEIGGSLFASGSGSTIVSSAPVSVNVPASSSSIPNIQAATTVGPSSSSSTSSYTPGVSSTASAASVPTAAAPMSGKIEAKIGKDTLSQASAAVSKSFSETTVKKIKEAVTQAMKDKPAQD